MVRSAQILSSVIGGLSLLSTGADSHVHRV